MNLEERRHIISLLDRGEEIPQDYQHILFPPERREYELVYSDKAREADVLANTMALPLQDVRTFGDKTAEWQNQLIFGDNLQVMKTLLEKKRAGKLCNADGTEGVRLIYSDKPLRNISSYISGTRTWFAHPSWL